MNAKTHPAEENPSGSTLRFAAKREAILDAAARVFNKEGIRGGTLSDIASGVGLATNSITYYYRRHEDLAAACLLRTIESLNCIVDKAAVHKTVSRRVEALFKESLRVLAAIRRGEHPELMSFADARALEGPNSQAVYAAYSAAAKRVRDLIRGPETAHLSKEALSARNYLLMSELLWLRLWTPSCDANEFDTIARRTSDLLLNGLHTPASTWGDSSSEASFWERRDARSGFDDPFLCAAATLVNRHGFHGASIERIAAHLNLTKGAFYGRGSNKDELIADCFEKKSVVMQLAWEGLEFGTMTGWERLCTALRRLMWLQLSALGPLVRTSAIHAVPGDEFQKSVRQAITRGEHLIADTIIDGMMDGSMRPCDPILAAHVVSCGIDHAAGVSGWARSVDAGNVADLFLKPMLYGLLHT